MLDILVVVWRACAVSGSPPDESSGPSSPASARVVACTLTGIAIGKGILPSPGDKVRVSLLPGNNV